MLTNIIVFAAGLIGILCASFLYDRSRFYRRELHFANLRGDDLDDGLKALRATLQERDERIRNGRAENEGLVRMLNALRSDLALSESVVRQRNEAIAQLQRRNRELEADVKIAEGHSMHALAAMDSANKRASDVEKLCRDLADRLPKALELAATFRKIVDEKMDGVNALQPTFKTVTDRLFIDLEEQRSMHRDLLKTAEATMAQLVTLSGHMAGLQRAGFRPPVDLSKGIAGSDDPVRFDSVDAADAAAMKEARNAARTVTVDAGE